MSDIESAINEVAKDNEAIANRLATMERPSRSPRLIVLSLLLTGTLVILVYQFWHHYSALIGPSQDKVTADVTHLLNQTDARLQRYRNPKGEYPVQLPAEVPRQLIRYTQVPTGYRLVATLGGVTMELRRFNNQVRLEQIEE